MSFMLLNNDGTVDPDEGFRKSRLSYVPGGVDTPERHTTCVPDSGLNQSGTDCSWFRSDSDARAREERKAITALLQEANWSFTHQARADYAKHLLAHEHTHDALREIWNGCHAGWVKNPSRMFASKLRKLCPNPHARPAPNMIPIAEAMRRVLR